MIKLVMSVYDHKAAMFCQPFFVGNEQVGMRAFVGAIENKDGDVGRFPQDFELYVLGKFDDETGRFDCGLPVSLGRGSKVAVGDNQMSLNLVEEKRRAS
ncbi:MAG: nonstructural protein [Microviridae sp.]|nr:MAG: nonstructural protein [Microviridae sp.]